MFEFLCNFEDLWASKVCSSGHLSGNKEQYFKGQNTCSLHRFQNMSIGTLTYFIQISWIFLKEKWFEYIPLTNSLHWKIVSPTLYFCLVNESDRIFTYSSHSEQFYLISLLYRKQVTYMYAQKCKWFVQSCRMKYKLRRSVPTTP